MSKLQIGKTLALPLNFLEHRKVVLGGSGTGKTAFGRVLYEEATKAGVVCGAIDLKADWWGLKSTADGKGDGIPVVIFGGEHQDVPLEEGGGAATAEIVVDLRQPFIIDLENFSKGKQMRFLAAFAERLYDRNREPLVMFWDEIDRYAPQKPMSPEANICLGAMEDIAKRGRKHGIFSTFITQRNAGLNKGVSELCDVAAVFRTPGPRDQEAVEDWFSTKATKEQRDIVMKNLAGLETGTCVLCSAHPKLRLFETVPIRMPDTFDSSATPEIGRRPIEPKRLAKPDLDKLRVRMAATIEKAKADDPKELRRKILNLERELNLAKAVTTTECEIQIKEVPVWTSEQTDTIKSMVADMKKMADGITQNAHVVEECLKRVVERLAVQPRHDVARRVLIRPSPSMRTHAHVSNNGDISIPQQRILDALAWLETVGVRHARRAQVAFLAGASPTSSAFMNNLGALRSGDLIQYPGDGNVALHDNGRGLAYVEDAPLSPGALHARIFEKLPRPQCAILKVLISLYPGSVSRERLAEDAGASPTSSAFMNNLGSLRSLGFIDYPDRGHVAAQPVLFLEGA